MWDHIEAGSDAMKPRNRKRKIGDPKDDYHHSRSTRRSEIQPNAM